MAEAAVSAAFVPRLPDVVEVLLPTAATQAQAVAVVTRVLQDKLAVRERRLIPPAILIVLRHVGETPPTPHRLVEVRQAVVQPVAERRAVVLQVVVQALEQALEQVVEERRAVVQPAVVQPVEARRVAEQPVEAHPVAEQVAVVRAAGAPAVAPVPPVPAVQAEVLVPHRLVAAVAAQLAEVQQAVVQPVAAQLAEVQPVEEQAVEEQAVEEHRAAEAPNPPVPANRVEAPNPPVPANRAEVHAHPAPVLLVGVLFPVKLRVGRVFAVGQGRPASPTKI